MNLGYSLTRTRIRINVMILVRDETLSLNKNSATSLAPQSSLLWKWIICSTFSPALPAALLCSYLSHDFPLSHHYFFLFYLWFLSPHTQNHNSSTSCRCRGSIFIQIHTLPHFLLSPVISPKTK